MKTVTLRKLESEAANMIARSTDQSSLEEWYFKVRDISIEDFSENDICIACRQNIFPDYIVPIAVDRLEKNPNYGYMYDGELVAALKCIREEYWIKQKEQARKLSKILRENHSTFNSLVLTDVVCLSQKLSNI